ncbi:MAG: diguanylate cyclase [Candidatus Omnitrophica bacterium]|nr:diguanylate cyclase [Candidatus Omnitrophota bacterium]
MSNLSYLYNLLLLILLCVCLIFWVTYLKSKVRKLSVKLKKTEDKFLSYSLIDNITGCYNYNYFIRRIKEDLHQSLRSNLPLSIIKLDIELFKNINTIYGVLEGDSILKDFAKFLKSMVRASDIVSRLEDDEFGIILNCTDKIGALILAQRIKRNLITSYFGEDNKRISLQVSMGLVTFPQDGESEIILLSLLDNCLNASKENKGEIFTLEKLKKIKETQLIDSYNVEDLKNKVEILTSMLGKTVIESIIAFANTIKAKDLYTAQHTEKTSEIALSIGEKLKLSSQQLEVIKYASYLHDLGKVGISESILKKPGKLTKEEFEEIKKHPIIGAEIIRPIHELKAIIPAILYHHEQFDGNGYPYGLKNNEIPLEAKIVAIADSFQALISHRPYRKAYTFSEAVKIIEEESGTHFDPFIVKTFKTVIEEFVPVD